MKIALGSDHAGYAIKETTKDYLKREGYEVSDFGTNSSSTPTDYPDIAFAVAHSVVSGRSERGVLVCGTGIGMSIAANKVCGARAAVCNDPHVARMSRAHNDANILTMGGRILTEDQAREIVSIWLETAFEGGRHERRIEAIKRYERLHMSNPDPLIEEGRVIVVDHPLVQHKLTTLRDKATSVKEFRELVQEIAGLMVYEATRNLQVEDSEVETPLGTARGKTIAGKKLAVVPVLRAGLVMSDGILRLIPNAKVGHIGLYRDPETLEPVEYYCKLPKDIEERDVMIVDPMLATGGSAAAAISAVKDRGGKRISLICLISAPEGLNVVRSSHPDVDIFTAAIDDHLDGHGYIIPGLGDAGDRLFGTR